MTDETKKSSPAFDLLHPASGAATPGDPASPERAGPDAEAFQAILTLVSKASGVDMRCYKERTLWRQTMRRCRAHGFAGLDAYLAT